MGEERKNILKKLKAGLKSFIQKDDQEFTVDTDWVNSVEGITVQEWASKLGEYDEDTLKTLKTITRVALERTPEERMSRIKTLNEKGMIVAAKGVEEVVEERRTKGQLVVNVFSLPQCDLEKLGIAFQQISEDLE